MKRLLSIVLIILSSRHAEFNESERRKSSFVHIYMMVKVKNRGETMHENFPTDFRKFRTTTESNEPPLATFENNHLAAN